ncbi:MAG: MATE family efflux transporter [Blautia obeum]
MSQNYGARNKKRVLKSYFISLFYSFTTGLILGLLLFIFGHQFMSLFATDAAVIDAGMQKIKIMAFSYCVSAFMDCTIDPGLGKPSFLRSLSFWDPVFSVLSGSTPFLPGFIQFRHYSFCISSHGSHIYRRNHLFHNNLQEAVIL